MIVRDLPQRRTFMTSRRREPFMPIVTVEGEKSFEVDAGKKLVLAIEDAGIDIMHRCGGNARCTTCRVEILAGQPTPMEALEQERLARETDLAPNTRLSCQIRVDSDLTVKVINRSSHTGIPAGTRPLD
jgi:ferredoxin